MTGEGATKQRGPARASRPEQAAWFVVAAIPILYVWMGVRSPGIVPGWLGLAYWFGAPVAIAYFLGPPLLLGFLRSPRAAIAFLAGASLAFLAGYWLA